jgi:hypothetical protein
MGDIFLSLAVRALTTAYLQKKKKKKERNYQYYQVNFGKHPKLTRQSKCHISHAEQLNDRNIKQIIWRFVPVGGGRVKGDGEVGVNMV